MVRSPSPRNRLLDVSRGVSINSRIPEDVALRRISSARPVMASMSAA